MGNAVAGGSFAWGFLAPLSFSQNVYSASGSTYSQGYTPSYAGLGVPAIGGVLGSVSVLQRPRRLDLGCRGFGRRRRTPNNN